MASTGFGGFSFQSPPPAVKTINENSFVVTGGAKKEQSRMELALITSPQQPSEGLRRRPTVKPPTKSAILTGRQGSYIIESENKTTIGEKTSVIQENSLIPLETETPASSSFWVLVYGIQSENPELADWALNVFLNTLGPTRRRQVASNRIIIEYMHEMDAQSALNYNTYRWEGKGQIVVIGVVALSSSDPLVKQAMDESSGGLETLWKTKSVQKPKVNEAESLTADSIMLAADKAKARKIGLCERFARWLLSIE